MSDEDTPIEVQLEPPKSARKPRPYRSKDRLHAKALELAAKNVSLADISKSTGIPYSTVKGLLQKFKPVFEQLDNVEEYRNTKADILAAAQIAVLKSAFSGSKLKKASFASTIAGFEALNKAERLESGQSTENVEHQLFGKIVIGREKG